MSVVEFPGPKKVTPVNILRIEAWSDGTTVVELENSELVTHAQWAWLYRRLADAMGVLATRNMDTMGE